MLARVITLYTFPGNEHLESMSPFCMKVEVYLEARGLAYRRMIGDPRKAPKGKLPYIDDDGTIVADSAAILQHLEKKATTPLDAGLDPAALPRAHVLRRMLEESLYWSLLYSRWVDDDGWAVLGPKIAKMLPAAVRWFLPGVVRGKVKSAAQAQGHARHGRDEVYAMGAADLDALAAMLGDGPWLLDDQPRTIDVVAYAFLANVLWWDRPSPLAAAAKKHPTLVAYAERARERFKAIGSTSKPAAA